MVAPERLICPSEALLDGGTGVRFQVALPDGPASAFVVRHAGRVHAYLNRCAHVPVEMDWQPGQFFDLTGHYLICAVHGALYDPADGRCLGGRCDGRRLMPVAVTEEDGGIFLVQGSLVA